MSIQTLVEKIKEKGNPTVAGLDARLEYIPQHISGRNMMLHGETLRAAAESVVAFNCGLIDALCDIVPAVKPQAAYYELLGSYGAMALKETIDYAHAKGMYVIGDIKRNDIGATYPEEQRIIRELLPKSYFLVPGYGAQGATAKDIANAFNDDGLGAIVNSSRGIMCAWKKTGNNGEDYKEAARAEAIRMRDDIVAAIK